eukprot:516197_1
MAQKKSIIQNLKNNLKLGPPSNKVQKYRKTPVYTSIDKPIYVDWLASKYNSKENKTININVNAKSDEKKDNEDNKNILSIDFKLGMTLCPGKHQDYAAITGCQWERDLQMDLKRLKEKCDVDVIVTLLSEDDLVTLKVENLIEEIEKHKMKSYWYKIPDCSIPNDVDLWEKMAIDVANELTVNNKNVIIHCMGGLNRTGMFVLSVLKYLKIIDNNTVDDGVKWIGKSRQGAGGNSQQIRFVKKLKFE